MAITTAVQRRSRGSRGQTARFLMTASTTIPKGAIVAVAAATGLVINAVAGTVNPVVGVAAETRTSPAGTETTWIEVEFDREFLFTATALVGQASVGEPVLVIDNDVVDEVSAGSAVVGILTQYNSATEGWVYVPGLTTKSVL